MPKPLTTTAVRVEVLAETLRPRLLLLANAFRRQNDRLPLTMSQGPVLGHLLKGPKRMTALAQLEGVQLASMTQMITRMEAAGWCRRTMATSDRRAVDVTITALGRRKVDEVIEARREMIARLIEGLSEDDRRALEAAVPALDRLLFLASVLPG
jgi:DNA-binding MarR family transcriptional regulator